MYQFRLWQYQLQTWPKLIIDFTQLHKVNYCEKSTSGSSTSRKARKPELDVWLLGVDRKDNVQLHWHPHHFTRASKTIQYIWNNITVERPLHGEFNNLFWSLPESHAMTKRVSCLALDGLELPPTATTRKLLTGIRCSLGHTHGIRLLETVTTSIYW